MNSLTPGAPSLLLAPPPGTVEGTWLHQWQTVLDAWPGDWHILDPDPRYVSSWRRRALEHCAGCWTVLPDAGCVPGALAFTLSLRAMAERAQVACVSIVPQSSISYHPELTPASSPFYGAPFVSGGVLMVKAPLAVKEALPEPRFYPYDFAEATFRMSRKGLTVLVLPDPSFIEHDLRIPLGASLRQAWHQGRGAAAFRLAHKGLAPRSLRLPANKAGLLLLGPWLVPSTAWRISRRPELKGGSGGVVARTIGPILKSTALWAGALRGYSTK